MTFNENSTIAISPVNFHATQLVLKAHKEAVNSLSGNGSAKLGTVATVVAAANSTARECSKEIEAAMQISLRNALGLVTNVPTDGPMDDLTIMKVDTQLSGFPSLLIYIIDFLGSFDMHDTPIRPTVVRQIGDNDEYPDNADAKKILLQFGPLSMENDLETLRVKDEELQNLARDLRARDSTIREIADKLSETAEAAESAASAAHIMDEQRRIACAEIERLAKDSENQKEAFMLKLRESEEKLGSLSKERDQLIRQRETAMQEAHMWRTELAKARESAVILEAAVVRAEEKVRVTEMDAEARIKDAAQKEAAAVKEKQELLAYVNVLQAHLQRQQSDAKQIFEEKTESSNTSNSPPDTKNVDLSENVDKACLSVSRAVPVPGESVVRMAVDQVNIQPVGEGEWSDIQATEARIADVREIAPETEGSSHDISVDNHAIDKHHEQGASSFRQP
ncbi:hypothetical protein Gohar_006411 [Gossypium harknessii]|uniref:Uncharacterized protein n=1 Tax=Gossypium harknessii TaxID=34285 RepID=A0A7J9GE03_9ROSI|nr:hypothetical protein [Gossypium harknessii]